MTPAQRGAGAQTATADVAEHVVPPPGVLPGRPALCELRDGTVCYGARPAIQGVSLSVQPGEVVALLGENGAGKSTALHSLYGLVPLTSGEARYGGSPVTASPERAIASGVGLVSQHFLLLPRLSVAENIVLGREPRRLGVFFDRPRAEREVQALADSYGLQVQPGRHVGSLSVGEAQRVEILKALYRGARCLLLDEPTAVLTPKEAITMLRALRARFVGEGQQGGLLIVTHKLDEVLEVADRAVVLRAGQVVAQVERSQFSARELAHALVGRTLVPVTRQSTTVAPQASQADPVLTLRDLHVVRDGVDRVRGVSLDLRPGTIVGIAGVEGNGQTELCLALAGLLPCASGSIVLGGQDITQDSVEARRQAGMAWVLEDRQRHGLVLDFSLAENLLLGRQHRYRHGASGSPTEPGSVDRRAGGWLTGWLIDQSRLAKDAAQLLTQHDVRPPDCTALARSLSGGNQQKLLLSRALADGQQGRAGGQVLVVAQPTRGVDIGAVQAIHQTLLAARDRGCAILLVSSELDELRALCDRIGVFYRGQLVAELDNPAAAPVERERLGELLAGLRVDVPAASTTAA